ncbi:hypothetical protein [Paraburkholderia fungorum]|uniref:hypothetical protein n=1 Tax=Paraburkholderia fungorum TaxID=134537 RepID=UPI001C1EE2D2|nr:hypothetical protein [Paraburkholderia fungorum]MBU7440225.1 hypothetical protein [Paraburkholderia fungorum]
MDIKSIQRSAFAKPAVAATKLILLTAAIGIVSAGTFMGIELFVLYKDIFVFTPMVIVETLRMIATTP